MGFLWDSWGARKVLIPVDGASRFTTTLQPSTRQWPYYYLELRGGAAGVGPYGLRVYKPEPTLPPTSAPPLDLSGRELFVGGTLLTVLLLVAALSTAVWYFRRPSAVPDKEALLSDADASGDPAL